MAGVSRAGQIFLWRIESNELAQALNHDESASAVLAKFKLPGLHLVVEVAPR
jgi:hypothetical protein